MSKKAATYYYQVHITLMGGQGKLNDSIWKLCFNMKHFAIRLETTNTNKGRVILF